MSMISKCAKQVGPVLPEIRKLIASSDVAHFDETGTDMNGRNFWVHCSSTGQLTLLTANQKRERRHGWQRSAPGVQRNCRS